MILSQGSHGSIERRSIFVPHRAIPLQHVVSVLQPSVMGLAVLANSA